LNGGGGDGADQALNLLYLFGILVLVGSALATRRLPWRRTASMALAWLLIFGAVFLVVALKDDFLALGRHVAARASGEAEAAPNGTLRVPRDEDGHFWVSGAVNGTRARFLVDSGATMTSLSAKLAAAAGIDTAGGIAVPVATANGIVKAPRPDRAARNRADPPDRFPGPCRRSLRSDQRARHELPLVAARLGRGRQCAGAAAVTEAATPPSGRAGESRRPCRDPVGFYIMYIIALYRKALA
jgi:aspartyl protease family protein